MGVGGIDLLSLWITDNEGQERATYYDVLTLAPSLAAEKRRTEPSDAVYCINVGPLFNGQLLTFKALAVFCGRENKRK